MWDEDETKNRLKELEVKLDDLQKHIEETEASLEDLEDGIEGEKANMFTVNQDTPPFQVHWIKPEETTSFSSCSSINSVEDAQKAFKEAAVHRDSSVKRVLHGDVLFLLCNKAPEPEPDPNDPDNIPEKGVCYYIGMCVKVSTVQMKKDPSSDYDELTETILTDTGEPNREFFAWDSCGGSSTGPECDREEQYVTVVTASKVKVTSTSTNPKIHTIRGYEKTKELQFDECGTLVSIGTETDWTETGEEHEIKECCDDPPPSNCNPALSHSSVGLKIVNDSTGVTEVDVTLTNDGTQCRYFDSTYAVQWSTTLNVWTVSGGQFSGSNHTEKGTYTGTAGFTITVS